MIEAGRAAFLDETRELLDTLEHDLMHLEGEPDDLDTVHSAFRALHTIKGSAGVVGFTEISRFSHRLETLFDRIRAGEQAVIPEVIDLGLEASDYIRDLLVAGPEAEGTEQGADLERRLDDSFGDATSNAGTVEVEAPTGKGEGTTASSATYRIRFRPEPSILHRGSDPLRLIGELRDLGTCLVFPVTSSIPPIEDMNAEDCYIAWTVCITTEVDANTLRDVFIFVEDFAEVDIKLLDDGCSIDTDTDYKRIGEILHERGELADEEVRQVLGEEKPFGTIAADRGLVTPGSVESALEEQRHVRDLRSQRQDTVQSSTTRVANTKLDEMVNLVGELVTLQARLSQCASEEESATEDSDEARSVRGSDLGGIAESLELVVGRLRENAMSVRLVPLAETFSSFYRLARDLGRSLEKDVTLSTTGGDTELDKNVIALLRDPLMHIVRNAVDHGIESPDERTAAGKEAVGSVRIEAEHAGADVLIRVIDDGRGLDADRIRRRAVERGVIPQSAAVSESDLYSLIFHPGFSTAVEATDVSGRGVGMDVVKRNIESLSGTVDVTSKPGEGTTVALRIPLTLAIIDSLLVEVAGERYVVNLSHVEECFILREDLLAGSRSRIVSRNTGEVLPFIDLRSVLDLPCGGPDIKNAVVVRDDDQKAALVVDRIAGQYQSVIKNLDPTLRGIEEVAGSTILGDGSVALILDVVKILRSTAVR